MIMPAGTLFDDGKYLIKKHLGEGYCSHVYLAEYLQGNICNNQPNLVALKVFKKGDEFTQMAEVERDLIKKMQDKWLATNRAIESLPIIRSQQVGGGNSGEQPIVSNDQFNNSVVYLSIEYCEQGDLFDIVKSKGALTKGIADTLFYNILDGLQCMHQLGEVAHLDLKLENILLTQDFRVKLCDFGFAQSTKLQCTKNLGTDAYKAPEIHKLASGHNHSYSGEHADLFALGVIFFTLHFGIPPFQVSDMKEDRLYKLISFKSNSTDKKGGMKIFLRNHPATKDLLAANKIDYDLMDLIFSLLSESPTDRPQDIQAVKDHPYFRKPDNKIMSQEKLIDTMLKIKPDTQF